MPMTIVISASTSSPRRLGGRRSKRRRLRQPILVEFGNPLVSSFSFMTYSRSCRGRYARMAWPRSDSLSTLELMQDVARRKSARLLQQRSAAGEIHRSSLPRFSVLDMCCRHRGARDRQELVAAVDEGGKQQTFRRDAANGPTCVPPGWRDRERANDIAAPMAAKAARRTMTSRLADNSCCGPAWSVLWPDPVRTANRHARSAEAAGTPTLMPQRGTTVSSPPGSPARDAGPAPT